MKTYKTQAEIGCRTISRRTAPEPRGACIDRDGAGAQLTNFVCSGKGALASARFDAYTATTRVLTVEDVLPWLAKSDDDTTSNATPLQGFGKRVAVKNEAGDQVASVSYGGYRKDLLMIEVKGERTDEAVTHLRLAAENHQCTRVDSRIDFEWPGAFNELLQLVLEVKQKYGIFGERRGDWDFPEDGRTQYIGANKSAIQARLYEKGKQPQLRYLGRPDLTRLELQVRPTKAQKAIYSKLSATEVWGASRLTRAVVQGLLNAELQPCPPGTIRKMADWESALIHMVKQYGRHMTRYAEELGSWECMGMTLRDSIMAERARMLHS